MIREEVVAKNAITTRHGAMEGKSQTREVTFYNLDLILSVGYRVNSKVATQFRKWATETLKQHITQGFTINQARIEKNREAFLQAVEDIRLLSSGVSEVSMDKVLDLVEVFAETWFALDQYDKGSFPEKGTVESIRIEVDELEESLKILKQELVTKGEASELFAQEKNAGSLEGIVGNIYQSVYGGEVYTSVEEKAAHLLYFMVKNHPFTDGNKRSGAFAFVWFLQKAGFEFRMKITPETLTTLTILIAESDPKDKERIIGLILLLLK